MSVKKISGIAGPVIKATGRKISNREKNKTSGVLITNKKESVIEKVPYKSVIKGPSTSSLVHPLKKNSKTKKNTLFGKRSNY